MLYTIDDMCDLMCSHPPASGTRVHRSLLCAPTVENAHIHKTKVDPRLHQGSVAYMSEVSACIYVNMGRCHLTEKQSGLTDIASFDFVFVLL